MTGHGGSARSGAVDFVEATGRVLKLMHRASDGLMGVFSNQEVADRIDRVPTKLGPYGVDAFGFDPEYTANPFDQRPGTR